MFSKSVIHSILLNSINSVLIPELTRKKFWYRWISHQHMIQFFLFSILICAINQYWFMILVDLYSQSFISWTGWNKSKLDKSMELRNSNGKVHTPLLRLSSFEQERIKVMFISIKFLLVFISIFLRKNITYFWVLLCFWVNPNQSLFPRWKCKKKYFFI